MLRRLLQLDYDLADAKRVIADALTAVPKAPKAAPAPAGAGP
jgi:hypothetical protein